MTATVLQLFKVSNESYRMSSNAVDKTTSVANCPLQINYNVLKDDNNRCRIPLSYRYCYG